MSSKQGITTEAFQQILLKMDETFIQAQSALRNLHGDTVAEKTVTNSELTTRPTSPVQSERSCSPQMPRAVSSTTISKKSSSGSTYEMKTKSFMAEDKKQAVILTSLKSKNGISEKDLKIITKGINDYLLQKDSSSSISSSSASIITL